MKKTKPLNLTIEGIPIQITLPDLDGDGITNERESIPNINLQGDITPIIQPTEMGEVIRDINSDTIDPETRQSGIDLRANILPISHISLTALESLVSMKICPSNCLGFTRQFKRNSVSINAMGRNNTVDIVAGKKQLELKQQLGITDRIKGMFGGQK